MTENRKNPIGPTGETVRHNVRRLRADLDLGYAELARRLEAIGRPIPVLGLRRIESGDRRVDGDDLVALALALKVNPNAILFPNTPGATEVEATGTGKVSPGALWAWANTQAPQAPTPALPVKARRAATPTANADIRTSESGLMTPAEVADYLGGLTLGYLAQLRYMGTGPRFIKLSARAVRYRRADIDDWIHSRTRVISSTGSLHP